MYHEERKRERGGRGREREREKGRREGEKKDVGNISNNFFPI